MFLGSSVMSGAIWQPEQLVLNNVTSFVDTGGEQADHKCSKNPKEMLDISFY
jgi:hypothetical protein